MSSLVSVIIATYNSSLFVIETLESVSRQTWENLELIITDDCSKDDTVEVCCTWLNENIQRFVHTEILTSEINTGISTNANRGLYKSKGNWVKFLGADDTLKPNCIEDNMSWVVSNPEVKILFSRIEIYKDTFEEKNLLETTPCAPYNPKGILDSGRSADSQYKMLLLCDRIHFTPSAFLHRETLLSIGGFDERFKLLEDYPLWLNLTKNGHKLYFMDKVTVNYRRHRKAVNNTGFDYLVNPNYFNSEDFRKVYTYPYLPFDLRLNAHFYWFASQIFRFDWLNRKNTLNKFLLALLTSYLNPFKYYIHLKKRLNKSLINNDYYL
jgi:glycosyltransferase involved in cell wall biosynthesis